MGILQSGEKRPEPDSGHDEAPTDAEATPETTDTELLRAAGNAKMEAGDAQGAVELYRQAVAAAGDAVHPARAALLNMSYASPARVRSFRGAAGPSRGDATATG